MCKSKERERERERGLKSSVMRPLNRVKVKTIFNGRVETMKTLFHAAAYYVKTLFTVTFRLLNFSYKVDFATVKRL